MSPIRILLANHQPIMRSGLRLLLEQESDFKVVAEAANGREAIVLSEYRQPHVALLEMKLPLVNGISAARELSVRARSTEVLFVTSETDEAYVQEAFKAGAKGYVDADHSATDLIRGIRFVAKGRAFLSPTISSRLFLHLLTKGRISELESDSWRLLAAGYDYDEIAGVLNVPLEAVTGVTQGAASSLCRKTLPKVLTEFLEAKPAF